jgi:hypothetical protein
MASFSIATTDSAADTILDKNQNEDGREAVVA